MLQLTNQQRPEHVEFGVDDQGTMLAMLVARRWIKLALVAAGPPQEVVQRHSIPHCLSPYSTQKHCCCTTHSIVLFLRQHPVHFPSLRLYPSPPPCILVLPSACAAACPSACKPVTRRRTWKSDFAFACCCTVPPSAVWPGLTLRQPIPPPLIITPKPGSPSRLPLVHHITSACGVQEHESARPAARW